MVETPIESADYPCLSEWGYGSFRPRSSGELIEINLGLLTGLIVIIIILLLLFQSDYTANQTLAELKLSWV